MIDDSTDKYPDTRKENWSGIIGLFLFPLFLLIFGVALIRNLTPVTSSVASYLPESGIGGAPPTLQPPYITNENFVIYDSSMRNNKITGYVDKGLYDSGARVYLNLVMSYTQQCIDNTRTSTETQSVVISKNADNYQLSRNQQGYEWSVNVQPAAPTDLCPSDTSGGDNINRNMMGRVYLSTSGGQNTLVDEETKRFYEILLDL